MNISKVAGVIIRLALSVAILYGFFLIPTVLRAKISSTLASYRARKILNSIPVFSEMDVISSYSVGDITSNSCYRGEAFMLFGTELSEKEIGAFYENFFSSWDWKIKNKLDTDPYNSFSVLSLEVDGYNRTIEGVIIRKCDEKCIIDNKLNEKVSNDNLRKHENLYLVTTWHLPFEIGNNLCWCCSGG